MILLNSFLFLKSSKDIFWLQERQFNNLVPNFKILKIDHPKAEPGCTCDEVRLIDLAKDKDIPCTCPWAKVGVPVHGAELLLLGFVAVPAAGSSSPPPTSLDLTR